MNNRWMVLGLVGAAALGAGWLVGGAPPEPVVTTAIAAAQTAAPIEVQAPSDLSREVLGPSVSRQGGVSPELEAAGPPAPVAEAGAAGTSPASWVDPNAPAGPEEALALQLGLTPQEAERVGEVVRQAEAELSEALCGLSERGYDDLQARLICQRWELDLIERVADVLPPARAPAFRRLMAEEQSALAAAGW